LEATTRTEPNQEGAATSSSSEAEADDAGAKAAKAALGWGERKPARQTARRRPANSLTFALAELPPEHLHVLEHLLLHLRHTPT
jgi:hypothetical protein